ncbi:MAG: response regulator [bacterium]|nr:response regulator [bacterium]
MYTTFIEKDVFSTFEAAEICNSSFMSINRWILSGELHAYKTPGGHRRIPKEDLVKFMRRNNIPIIEKHSEYKWKILVVDDDDQVRNSMVKNLWRFNNDFEVVSADNGYEAGIMVSQFSPDVIILDILMPILNGFKICESIKNNPDTQDTIIIVVTGYGTNENVKKAYKCKADKVLFKPVKSKDLVAEIRFLIKQYQK